MAINTENVANANDTLARRRQINTTIQLRRQEEVYSRVPEIEDLGYQMTSLGVDFTMAKLAKQEEKAAEIKRQMVALQDKRRQLLVQNGFDENWLEAIYTCALCKDKGFVDGKICSLYSPLPSTKNTPTSFWRCIWKKASLLMLFCRFPSTM